MIFVDPFLSNGRKLLTLVRASSALGIARGLALRHLLARILSVSGLILAAYVYRPSDFADVGVYLALLNILWIVLFLRFEAAIAASSHTFDIYAAFHLCLRVGAIIGGIFVFILIGIVSMGLLSPWVAAMMVLGLAGRGLLRLIFALATQSGHFRLLGQASLLQAVVQPLVIASLVLTPLDGGNVMMMADCVGVLSAALYAGFRQKKELVIFWDWPMRAGMLRFYSRKWRALPLYNLPGALFSVLFSSWPLLIVPLLTDETHAGATALAYRLLDMPTQLIGVAATPVLLHRLRQNSGRSLMTAREGIAAFSIGIFVIYGCMSGATFLLEEPLAATKWLGLVRVLPILALFHAGLALAGPMSEAVGLFRKQQSLLNVQLIALVSLGIVTWSSYLSLSPLLFLISIGVISMLRAVVIALHVLTLYREERLSQNQPL